MTTPRVYNRAGYIKGLDDPEHDYRGGNPDWFVVLFPNGIDGVAAEAQTRWVLFMCDTFAVRVEVDLLEEARKVRAWIAAHPERAPARANLAAYFSGWCDNSILAYRSKILKHGKPAALDRKRQQ